MQKLFCLVAVFLSTAILCNAQRTELRLNLQKGNVYKQVTNAETTIVQDVGGQKLNITMAIEGTFSFLVTSVTDAGYDMDAKFESLSMSINTPQGSMDFSSERVDSTDVFSLILGSMINKVFKVAMTRSGEITWVGDVEKLWDGAIDQFPELSEIQRNQIKAQLLNAYGEKALKGNIEMVTAVYPDRAVRIGEKWTVNTNLESGMSAEVTSEYEFTKMTADHVFLKGASKIETSDKDAYIETNGMPMRYNLKGKMTSEIRADRKTGWIEEARINQEIAGDTQIKDNPQIPGGMTIPMTMTSKISITN